MHSTYTLLKLVATSCKDADKIATCEYDKITDNDKMIPRNYDAYDQLHLHITLPPLTNNQYWKNNLLVHLIKSITINIHNMTYGKTIEYTFDNSYIKNIINNKLPNYCNNLLFRNLSVEKRIKKSKKEQMLILPLVGVVPLVGCWNCCMKFDVEFFDSGFIENSLGEMPIIKSDIYALCYMYNIEPRRQLQNHAELLKNKEEYDAFIENLETIIEDKQTVNALQLQPQQNQPYQNQLDKQHPQITFLED